MKCENVVVVLLLAVTFFAESQAKCDTLLAKGVSEKEKDIIVNRHNEIRLAAARGEIPGQPKASNMKRMSWDNYLGDEAQKIAETCIFAHVPVNDSRFAVGQNLFAFSSTAPNQTADWVSGINAWYNEYKTFVFGSLELNHYTQVVWADTYLVGCGYTYYQKSGSSWYDKMYVCNYGPAGNYVGSNPYKTGPGCENLC